MSAQKKSRQVIRHNEESAPTFYANNAQIRGTQWDIRISMGEILDATEDRLDVRDVVHVYMSLQHAKAFANAMARTIQEHEEKIGPIQMFDPDQNASKVAAKTDARKRKK